MANVAAWVDMGDIADTVIKIELIGWHIVRDGVGVLFRRTALTRVLAEPQRVAGTTGLRLALSTADQALSNDDSSGRQE
jgi:hypothetical protein